MAGWNQKAGELINNEEANLFSIVSHSLLSKQYKTTTYKFCFFKSLLDNIYKTSKYELPFETLSYTFAQIYWNMINVYEIPQMPKVETGKKSSVEVLINKLRLKNPNITKVRYESIPPEIRQTFQKNMQNIFSSYVIGAFYEETKGLLYGYSKKEKKIYLNRKTLDFLINHKIVFEQLCYYEWLKMCETILSSYNRYIPNLTTIFEEITLRKDLSTFKKELDNLLIERRCFYDGKYSSLSLDHVIPWNYIKSDDLWNLVWCCRKCNSSKNSKVPPINFISKLIERNNKYEIKTPDILKIYNDAIINGVDVWKHNK